MTFDICADCFPSLYGASFTVGLVWALPTLVYALRRQLPSGAWLKQALLPIVWILCLGAVPVSLALFAVIDFGSDGARVAFRVLGGAVGASLLVLAVLGASHRRLRDQGTR